MSQRLGGELEIGLEQLRSSSRFPLPTLPKPESLWMDSGRAALRVALEDILRRGGRRKAWLPAYVCASVIAPFRALNFEIAFYPCGEDLRDPVFPESVGAGEVFLYVHYFGRRNDAAIAWLGLVHRGGDFFVIEDCVQASLNRNVGDHGSYAITSYRKFLPQPDGALLGSATPLRDLDVAEADEAFVSARFLGKLLRKRSTPESEAAYLRLFQESEDRLEAASKPRRMSWLSGYLMGRTDCAAIARRRRANWKALATALAEASLPGDALRPLFTGLAKDDVPLGFPIRVARGKREGLRQWLRARRIYCPVHWDLPHLADGGPWGAEIALSHSILTLPIDQRVGRAHLQAMVRAIESFYAEET